MVTVLVLRFDFALGVSFAFPLFGRLDGVRERAVSFARLLLVLVDALCGVRPRVPRRGLEVADDDGTTERFALRPRLLIDRPTDFMAVFCSSVSVAHVCGCMWCGAATSILAAASDNAVATWW